jgi:hypothetical protein
MADERAPKLQNFSLASGDDLTFYVDIGPDGSGATLDGADLHWRAWPQTHGIPDFTVDPVIEKSIGAGIVIINESAQQLSIQLEREDTLLSPGNYYHELNLEDIDNKQSTPTVGIMTITRTRGDEV